MWLTVAKNATFARTMLYGLMDRLQLQFGPKINAMSKADIWRTAAVDPLMVSGMGRTPRTPQGLELHS